MAIARRRLASNGVTVSGLVVPAGEWSAVVAGSRDSVGSAASAEAVCCGTRAGIGQAQAMMEKIADTAAEMSHSWRQPAKLPASNARDREAQMPKPTPPYAQPPGRVLRVGE